MWHWFHIYWLVHTCDVYHDFPVPSLFVDNPKVVASQARALLRPSYGDEMGHDISYRNGVEYDGIEHVSLNEPTSWNVYGQDNSTHNLEVEEEVDIGLTLNGNRYYH